MISETAKPRPAAEVRRWLAAKPLESAFLAATVVGELARGIERLGAGRRRRTLTDWLEHDLRPRFAGRILAFDEEAALLWGRLMAQGERDGRAPANRDCQIAATAIRHRLVVVTRNASDFEPLGVPVLDSWRADPGSA